MSVPTITRVNLSIEFEDEQIRIGGSDDEK